MHQTIWFAIPVTFDTQVNFGFFADFLVNAGDAYGVPADLATSGETVDPPSFSYGGPGYEALAGGGIDNDLVFGESASGYDYDYAYTPEPASAFCLLSGIALIAYRRLKSRRQ